MKLESTYDPDAADHSKKGSQVLWEFGELGNTPFLNFIIYLSLAEVCYFILKGIAFRYKKQIIP